MARAVLSWMDDFTDIINQEESHLEATDIHTNVQLIRSKLLAMQSFLKEADIKEVERDLLVIIHDAEATIVNHVLGTTQRGKKKPLFKRCPCWKNSGAHKNFCNEIDRILKSINTVVEGLNYASFEESSISHDSGGKSFNLSDWMRSSVDFDEADEEDLSSTVAIGLRQDDIKSLERQLLGSGDYSVISILGIQGIGKTTLAWEIYKSSFVVEQFDCKAWVCVSAMDNDLEEIKKNIDNQFYINDAKRYLVVLDDIDLQIWSVLPKWLEELYLLIEKKPMCKIILTTRDAGVASSAHYSHRLKVLNKEESWKLFSRKLSIAPWQLGNASGKDETRESESESKNKSPIPTALPSELEDLGRKMVEKCGGIPGLITELANLLSTKYANTVEWSCVLHGTDTHLSQDQNHPWFNLSSYVDKILPPHVKQVMKFLHLFPKDTEIPERRLIRSWDVEGLLHLSNSGGEEATLQLVQDLQDLNLIQAAKVSSVGITKAYRIPRDLPLLQILKAGTVRGSYHDDSKVFIRRLADYYNENLHSRRIHSNINPPEELELYKTLHYFWCFNYPGGYKPGQEVGSFLKRCITNNHLWYLRVLDLEGVYKPSLPAAIGELINLRYLGLRWTYLDTLPSSVGNLTNLQTLDTKHTDIGQYPSIEYMKKLQHLYLNERHPNPSELLTQLSNLSELQTLSGVIVDNSSHVKDGLAKLRNIRKLRLTCQRLDKQQGEEMVNWIGGLEKLQTLKLTFKNELNWLPSVTIIRNKQLSRVYLQGSLENLYTSFGSNLTALTLSLSQQDTDPMTVLEELPKLKVLRLFSKSYTGSEMRCSSGRFQQLRVLKIWKLKELEEWFVEQGAMPQLEELEIRSCTNLKSLPDVPKSLLELKITDMPKEFTSKVKGEDRKKVAHVSSVIIEDWSGSNTSSVELYKGENSVFQGQLEKIFGVNGLGASLTELTLSEIKLEQDPMPVLEKLPELTVLILSSQSFIGKLMVCSKGGFKKLKQLTIQELEELEELTVKDGAMVKLEELEIRACKELKELPQVLGTLKKKLKLAKMPEKFTEKFKADKRIDIED